MSGAYCANPSIRASKRKNCEYLYRFKVCIFIVYAHGALYKEKGLINSAGQSIKNGAEVTKLLATIFFPDKMAVMHCRGHQHGNDPVARGNRLADQATKQAALQEGQGEAVIAPMIQVPLETFSPQYSQAEHKLAERILQTTFDQGWWILPDKRPFVPQNCAWELTQ